MNNKFHKDKIVEILRRRKSFLINFLENVEDLHQLSKEIRLKIADELGDEFCSKGLKEDSEPNAYGLEIETLIDACIINE